MTQPQPWRVLLVVLVAALVSAGGAMVYANRVAQQSERRQCSVLAAELAVYRESPPSTRTGQRLAAAKEQLLRDLRCR